MRLPALAVLALLTGCIPTRQTYFEAVGGIVTPQETLSRCRPDHFTVRGAPSSAVLQAYAWFEKGKPQLGLDLYSGQELRVDFEPHELQVEALGAPEVRQSLPLIFFARCETGARSDPCRHALWGPPPIEWGDYRRPIVIHYQQELPDAYANGFSVHLPSMSSDQLRSDTRTVTFRAVTEVVSSGTFGCHDGF
jgi:hypothetical protein